MNPINIILVDNLYLVFFMFIFIILFFTYAPTGQKMT